jgi:hypothetical protein
VEQLRNLPDVEDILAGELSAVWLGWLREHALYEY